MQSLQALVDGTFETAEPFTRDTRKGAPNLRQQQVAWIGKRFQFAALRGITEGVWAAVQAENEDCVGADDDIDPGN